MIELLLKLGAVASWTLVVFGTGIYVERHKRRRPRLALPPKRGWR